MSGLFIFSKVLTHLSCSRTQNLLHSSSIPEYKAASVKKPFSVLSHYGLFKTCWDWLILIATFYVAIAVPYFVAFRYSSTQELFRNATDTFRNGSTHELTNWSQSTETPIAKYVDVLVEIIFIIGKLVAISRRILGE